MRRRLWLLALAALGVALVAWLSTRPGPEPAPEETQAATQATPGAPALAVTPMGQVSGSVVRDGRPVPRARVVLRGVQARVVSTNLDGTFAVSEVPAGPVFLSATDGEAVSEVLGPLQVPAGAALTSVVLRLRPSVRLEGQVVELLGHQPVAAATITLALETLRADASGRFSVLGPRGPTWLEVTAQGYLPRAEWVSLELARAGGRLVVVLTPASTLQGQVLESGGPVAGATVWAESLEGGARGQRTASVFTGPEGAFSVEATSGLVRLAAVTPRGTRITGPLLRLGVGARVQGLVLDAGDPAPAEGLVTRDGQPLAGAHLLALAAATEVVVGTATSAGDGRFTFPSLVAGRYLVQVQRGPLASVFGPLEHPGDGTPWRVTLSGGQVLEGRVEPAAPGVRVSWRSGGWSGPPVQVLTDAQGRFRFEGLADELLSLEAEGKEGSATARARPGNEVVLRLRGGQVVVHLQDDLGAPVTDGVLLARSLDTGLTRRQVVLAPTGVIPVTLPAGPWALTLEVAGRGRSATARIDVGDSPLDVILSLEAAVSVSGTVRDGDTHLPLAGVEVSAASGSDANPFRVVVVTGARGDFSLPPAPRTARLSTFHPAFLPQARAAAESARWEVLLAHAPHPMPSQPAIQFEGVGLVLDGRGGVVRVAQVNEGGPAERAGVQVADAVLAVDGVATSQLPLDQTVARIRGPSGTPVQLLVERAGQRFELTVRRRLLTL